MMKALKMSVCLCLIMCIQDATANQSILHNIIELKHHSYSINELFHELRTIHQVPMAFGNLRDSREIQFETKKLSLQNVLDEALRETQLSYLVKNGKVLIVPNRSGEKATISGFVRDKKTGEVLIGATVYDGSSGNGAITNSYGFFSITLIQTKVDLVASYLGYSSFSVSLELKEDTTLYIELQESTDYLEEVTITGQSASKSNSQANLLSLTSKEISMTPTIMGESDVLKVIQLLPGIKGGLEGTSGIYVRGGGPDQNLILMDGVPIYNAAHLFGFFSIFNPDAINKVDVHKGGFSAKYGGRLSSVIDISMKEGNKEKLSGTGTVGLISSKFTAEGPIKSERTSFLLSGRRTYWDLFTKPFQGDEETLYNFIDFNAKINHLFSDKDRLFLSLYGGRDKLYSASSTSFQGNSNPSNSTYEFGLKWGNLLSVLRWNHIYGPKLFGSTSVALSRYKFDTYDKVQSSKAEENEKTNYVSGLNDLHLKTDFEFLPNPIHSFSFGASYTRHSFNTGAISLENTFEEKEAATDAVLSDEFALYFADNFRVGKMAIDAGVHSSFFLVRGKTYSSIQPRLSSKFDLTSTFSISASYSEMAQYIHLLTNSGIGMPTDLWVPTTNNLKPQLSRQFAVGLSKTFSYVSISVDSYYKEMNHLIEYKNGASYITTNTDWEDKVISGDGSSKGVEVLFRKHAGELTGWVGYTLSNTQRNFDLLNGGKSFPFKYDRRHDLSIVGNYKLKKHVLLSGTWSFASGNALTIAKSSYQGADYFDGYYRGGILQYDERNNYRMRPSHRLDLTISWEKERKKGIRTWALGAYNLYNRKNPSAVVLRTEGMYSLSEPKLVESSLFSFIPFVNYTFKFL